MASDTYDLTCKVILDISPEDRETLAILKWLRETEEQKKAIPVQLRRETSIFVNGRQRSVTEQEVSFDQIVSLSINPLVDITRQRPERYTVTYRNGPIENAEGSLRIGQKVKVIDHMAFSAAIVN